MKQNQYDSLSIVGTRKSSSSIRTRENPFSPRNNLRISSCSLFSWSYFLKCQYIMKHITEIYQSVCKKHCYIDVGNGCWRRFWDVSERYNDSVTKILKLSSLCNRRHDCSGYSHEKLIDIVLNLHPAISSAVNAITP